MRPASGTLRVFGLSSIVEALIPAFPAVGLTDTVLHVHTIGRHNVTIKYSIQYSTPTEMARLIPHTFREFTWSRDSGYRLWDSAGRVVGSGAHRKSYKPLERNDNLFGQFASIPQTPEGVLDFITKFGPLTLDGLQESGDDVAAALEGARSMAGLLRAVGEGQSPTQLPSQHRSMRLTLRVGYPATSGTLTVLPETLLDAIWLQLAEALSSGAQIRRCEHCKAWFAAGAGFGRRREAKFCSDEHRILYNSLKRTAGTG